MPARTHGHSICDANGRRSPTYSIWSSMKNRCLNPRDGRYSMYGGSGITICESWKSFEAFLHDMGERPTGMSIDRIDNRSGYSPENCRWATQKEQQRNKRGTHHVMHLGVIKPLIEWCEILSLDYRIALRRIKIGDSPEEALRRAGIPPGPAIKFSDEVVEAARVAEGTNAEVGRRFGMSAAYVRLLRLGKVRSSKGERNV